MSSGSSWLGERMLIIDENLSAAIDCLHLAGPKRLLKIETSRYGDLPGFIYFH